MKLTTTGILTKIAAFLVVSARAVNGQCPDVPAIVQSLSLGGTYCYLQSVDPRRADLFATVLAKAFEIDPTYGFILHCLEDLLGSFEIGTPRAVCNDGKTELAMFSKVVSTIIPLNSDAWGVNNGTVETDVAWGVPMCKSALCNTEVFNQVLTETWSDFFDLVDADWRNFGFKAIATYAPTAECVYDQIDIPVNNPELYCSGDNAPVCNNIRLAEITLGDDAPFEVAICDDNNCLASLGASDVVGYYANGARGRDPFCIVIEGENDNFMARFQETSAKISDKAFNLSNYCSAAAASKRTGRCEPPTDAPVTLQPVIPPTDAPVTLQPVIPPTDAPVTLQPVIPPTVSPVVVTKAPVRMTSAPVPAQVPVPTPVPAVSAPTKGKKSKKGKGKRNGESFFN